MPVALQFYQYMPTFPSNYYGHTGSESAINFRFDATVSCLGSVSHRAYNLSHAYFKKQCPMKADTYVRETLQSTVSGSPPKPFPVFLFPLAFSPCIYSTLVDIFHAMLQLLHRLAMKLENAEVRGEQIYTADSVLLMFQVIFKV